jgi:hypothetical protein
MDSPDEPPPIQLLAATIKVFAFEYASFYWRLSGNFEGPKTLSCFLDVEEEELNSLLRLCGVYKGANDNLNQKCLEELCRLCDTEPSFTTVHKKKVHFILLGDNGGDIVKPANMYHSNGNLKEFPIPGVHMKDCRRLRNQRGNIPKLLAAAGTMPVDNPKPKKASNKQINPKSCIDTIVNLVVEILDKAVERNDPLLSKTAKRKLERDIKKAINAEARVLLIIH